MQQAHDPAVVLVVGGTRSRNRIRRRILTGLAATAAIHRVQPHHEARRWNAFVIGGTASGEGNTTVMLRAIASHLVAAAVRNRSSTAEQVRV